MEFQNIPKFNGIIQTKLSQNNMSILQQEIDSLLKKEAIEPVYQNLNQGFYSTFFLVPKKTGGMRPVIKTPQPVSTDNTLQNGNTKVSSQFGSKRRLCNISRSDGCLSTFAYISKAQNASQILCTASSLPISSYGFWAQSCTKNIYKMCDSNCSVSTATQSKVGSVSGRLARSKGNQIRHSPGSR
ncbi:hypothetical protein DPMN_072327 [Dreissena polymorpha]|uniref:Uncharacterized protein n=1 Tax=Dreissena polymorpha TaxID=45954 RepID=A0A9D4BWS8_DREPO|nr:hypothetical protein DPMN_072327 [Dreissena polymorpha]